MKPCVAIVLLAAGEGRRYGGIKQLAVVDGKPMVRRAAQTALDTGATLIVVTGAHAVQVEAALDGLPLHLVRHDAWQEGMGSSLAAGIRHLQAMSPSASAALFCLADQPLVDTAMLARMLERHAAAPQRILAADQGDDVIGPPVLFPRDCFDALMAWSGPRGAQGLLRREAARVEKFAFGVIADVDTPADLRRLHEQLQYRAQALANPPSLDP